MNEPLKFGIKSKAEICALYGISKSTLQRLLNKKYFEQLSAVGYQKHSQLLSPNQVQTFINLYGEP